jgi:hypothetical protein
MVGDQQQLRRDFFGTCGFGTLATLRFDTVRDLPTPFCDGTHTSCSILNVFRQAPETFD